MTSELGTKESDQSSPGAHKPASGCLGNLEGPLLFLQDKPAASHDADSSVEEGWKWCGP